MNQVDTAISPLPIIPLWMGKFVQYGVALLQKKIKTTLDFQSSVIKF